jgi:transposase
MDQLVEAISAETGFSTRWVYKYLDKKFKRKTKPSNPKEIAYHAISPYRRIVLYLSNEKARLLDALTTQKGFKELSDTILWLIDEALRLVGKSIPEVRS